MEQEQDKDKDKDKYFKGRGAQINTDNRFLKNTYKAEHIEALDEEWMGDERTKIFFEYPKKIINKVESPDLRGMYSMNPYQGCEHGCIYCYARNTHEYWGFSAGLDFERKIIAKPDAAKTLEKQLSTKGWVVQPIMFSGNTDCYQPLERKMKITRSMLEVLLRFRHPAGMITKNSLILRDMDILKEMAKLNLVHVMVSINSLNEDLRQKLEPRTANYKQRLKVVETLNNNGIPCGIMCAPIIPGLNSEDIPSVIKAAGERGADSAGFTIVRLNGSIGQLFKDWLFKNFPDRADKVWNQICDAHGGKVNDSRYGVRMRGEGKIADAIKQLFRSSVKQYITKERDFEFDLTLFEKPEDRRQMKLF